MRLLRLVMALGSGSKDGVADAVEIGHDVQIPETQHAIPALAQPDIASQIADLAPLEAVLIAIDFNNQRPFGTEEIDDVGADRRLAAEAKPLQPRLPQALPKPQFGPGHVLPHGLGETAIARRHDLVRQWDLRRLRTTMSMVVDAGWKRQSAGVSGGDAPSPGAQARHPLLQGGEGWARPMPPGH